MKHLCVLLAMGIVAGASAKDSRIDLSKLPPASQEQGLTYDKQIRPMLETSCFRCHGAERPKAGLRLDSLDGVLKGSKEGKVVVPGDSQKSQIVLAVSQLDPETAMPPKPRAGRGKRGPGGPGGPGSSMTSTNAPSDGTHSGGGPGAPGRPMGPPPKPLTPEQVGLVRAWIDQGAK